MKIDILKTQKAFFKKSSIFFVNVTIEGYQNSILKHLKFQALSERNAQLKKKNGQSISELGMQQTGMPNCKTVPKEFTEFFVC